MLPCSLPSPPHSHRNRYEISEMRAKSRVTKRLKMPDVGWALSHCWLYWRWQQSPSQQPRGNRASISSRAATRAARVRQPYLGGWPIDRKMHRIECVCTGRSGPLDDQSGTWNPLEPRRAMVPGVHGSLLHPDTGPRVWPRLEQHQHFDRVWVWGGVC